ncbi:MAG: hypothetical protein RIE73_00040 [Coleofasciculus sp. C1-SOL-03]|uniref:hypothetical protein n=1 Tax=Coleofasciculus sp. C1-SOL-03 TaxID=3069522 RepID=UPI0032FF6BFA
MADDAALLWDNLTNLGHFPGLTTLKSHLICYTNTEYTPQNEPGQKTYWLTHAQKEMETNLTNFDTKQQHQKISDKAS